MRALFRVPRRLGLGVFIVLAALGSLTRAATPERPNIVFIIADDLGWADVAFHGGNAPTPHLDRLAREGVELSQHYVAPVCTPTRAALMTGRYWSRFGITQPAAERALPWDTVTLPRALQQAGYATCLTGKWHLGSQPGEGPQKFGFDHSYGSLGGGVGPYDHRYKVGEHSLTWHRNGERITEQGHVTDLIANEAIGWLGRQGRDTPFFLYVPFTAVHLPVKEPEEWVRRAPAKISSEVARHYAACIMHLDDAIGKIVTALEKNGQRERTIVVFTSDNGGSQAENDGQAYPKDGYPVGKLPGNNAPLRGNKGDLYEGGIRVPTIVNWPGRLAAGKIDAPVHIIDWMPTFTALAGVTPPKDLKWDGMDIWPVVSGKAKAAPRTLYWLGPGMNSRVLREGDWKLVLTGKVEPMKPELFNLAQDPSEKTDLAAGQPERVASMKALLTRLAKADGDARLKK